MNVDEGLCDGCGLCIEACQRRVLTIANRRPASLEDGTCLDCGACTGEDGCLFEPARRIAVIADQDACNACGDCVLRCHREALRLRAEAAAGPHRRGPDMT